MRGLFVIVHEARVACHVSRDYRRQPASDPTWLLLLHGQAAPGDIILPEMLSDTSLGLGGRAVNKWNTRPLKHKRTP